LKNILFIILFICALVSKSLATEVFGSSKEYANNELIFYKYSDRITCTKEKIFSLKINENGDFRTEIDLDEITYTFGEFGIYHAYFYAEPSGSYELILPPFADKKEKDIFNPFFEPEEIHIGIKNLKTTDLNYLILDFDYYYDRYLSHYIMDIYYAGLDSNVDTFINNINDHYTHIDNPYFKSYKDYRIANLKNIATQKKYEMAISVAYYANEPILYDNPAYMDLFNSMYNSYFDKYLISKKGPLLYSVLNYGHSIYRLHKLLSHEIEFRNIQFREMVIMKGIQDALYNKNLEWLPLLTTLDSLIITTEYPLHKKIAQKIADNALNLASNTVAPIFELPDGKGKNINIKDFQGKYVYLQFANTQSYSSKLEFDLLKKIYERYKGICVFITILTDEDKDKAEKFIRNNKLDWLFLYTTINSPVISMYNISAYPTYYLIDPEGILKMSPAPSPSENFETYFFKIVENEINNN